MVRKIVAATVSAALCTMSVTPALAQDYRYSGYDAPLGATATLNFRVPLGTSVKKAKPSYGLSLGYGKTMGAGYDGRPISRAVQLADLRFGADGALDRAQVASFDLANLDDDKRLNLTGGDNTLFIVVGLVAAGVAVCLLADCFDGDDDESSSN